MIIRKTVFGQCVGPTQNYIAMRDFNCAIQMTVRTVIWIWIAQFKWRSRRWFELNTIEIMHGDVILRTHGSKYRHWNGDIILRTQGPKYHHWNDHSNCALLLSCENSLRCFKKDAVQIAYCKPDLVYKKWHVSKLHDLSVKHREQNKVRLYVEVNRGSSQGVPPWSS